MAEYIPSDINKITASTVAGFGSILEKVNALFKGSSFAPGRTALYLLRMEDAVGRDNVVALADITSKLRDYNIGLLGASTSVYGSRIEGFVGTVQNYQAALMDYRYAVKSNRATQALAKQTAHRAFQEMQRNFQHELASVTARARAHRGTPLTSANRATNIARSSRHVTKLNVMSQAQASNLVKFGRYTKVLGNGLAVIDFGSRVGNIHNAYQAGDKWEREMFVESSSFVAGTLTGTLTVKAGLALLVVATPAGWVGLIVGGVAVAGVAAGTSMGVNNYFKENSGEWYDNIMKFLTL